MGFKKGDIVELKNNYALVASIGAKAVVVDVDEIYVHVKWLDKQRQADEKYYFSRFLSNVETEANIPNNNNGRETCFSCNSPTKKVNTGFSFYDVCSNCGK